MAIELTTPQNPMTRDSSSPSQNINGESSNLFEPRSIYESLIAAAMLSVNCVG